MWTIGTRRQYATLNHNLVNVECNVECWRKRRLHVHARPPSPVDRCGDNGGEGGGENERGQALLVRLFVCSFVRSPVWPTSRPDSWHARGRSTTCASFPVVVARGIINRWPMSGFHLLSRSLLRRLDAGSLLRAWNIAARRQFPFPRSSGNWARE